MKQVLILFIILVLIGGCERKLDSGNVGFETPDDLPVPTALKILHLADGVELNWQIPDSSKVAYFKIYYSNQEPTDGEEIEFIYLDSTSAFVKTITSLNSGQVYYFKIAMVNTNGVEGAKSISVSSRIGVTSIVINDNSTYTNSTDVSISFVYPVTPTLVKISENENLTDAVWQNFRQPSNFKLTDNDGVKYIYALLRFNDGSESSGSISDSIILDTKAFIDSTYFQSDSSVLMTGDTIYFFVVAGEIGGKAYVSFASTGPMALYDNGASGDATANDGIYSRLYIVPVNLEINDGVVTGSFTDAAGNSADNMVSSSRINIAIPPEPISLQAIGESFSQIHLSWSEVDPGTSDFSSYRIYRSTATGVDETSELIANIVSRTTLSYTDNNLDENQLYFYRIYAYTAGGLYTLSGESSATTMAFTPEPISLQAIGESSSQIHLSWSEVDPGNFYFSSYRIYRSTSTGVDETSKLIANITSRASLSYTDNNLDDNQQYFYRIYAYTAEGLLTQSEESSAITFVNSPPTAVTLAVGLIDDLTVSISWTENIDADFESYQIYRGNAIDVTDLTGQRLIAINNQQQTSYTDVRSDVLDTYYYVIYVYDRQGLKSSKSNVESTP